MRNAEIGKMPSEPWSERRVIVCLDFLDGGRRIPTDFTQEVDGSLGVVEIVDV